jgi:hypothetical protein
MSAVVRVIEEYGQFSNKEFGNGFCVYIADEQTGNEVPLTPFLSQRKEVAKQQAIVVLSSLQLKVSVL